MDGIHDLGGMHGFGAVVEPGGEAPYHQRWEPRILALHILMDLQRLGAGPGGRATREQMDPADYLAASYFERWLWSAEQRLLRKGTIAPGEVERMMERIAAGGPQPPAHRDPEQAARAIGWLRKANPMEPATRARFAPGQRVRVRRMRPAGHTRCPRYVRGAVGVVERVHGADTLPDLAAQGTGAPVEPVYGVAFRSEDLWGRGEEPPWTVALDLWESYLEEAG
jgi:nitrile hydratase subunit beta